jgi:hypothetical protein
LFPLGGFFKIRPDSKRGPPIEIFRRIVAVSERRWDRDNALVCIVRKRDKYMNQARRGLGSRTPGVKEHQSVKNNEDVPQTFHRWVFVDSHH